MKILSVDPGTHTGWAFVDTELGVGASFEGGELGPVEASWAEEYVMAAELLSLALEREVDRIVIEDFMLLPASVKGGMSSDRTGLSSVRVGALVYAFLRDHWPDSEIFWQYPSVMTVIDSGRLTRAGMWVVGSEHARDAAKHLLIHLRKEVRKWED